MHQHLLPIPITSMYVCMYVYMYVLHRFLITDEHLQSQYALTFMSVYRQMAMMTRVACCASRPSYTFNSAEKCGKWMIRHTLVNTFFSRNICTVCMCMYISVLTRWATCCRHIRSLSSPDSFQCNLTSLSLRITYPDPKKKEQQAGIIAAELRY